MRRLFSAAATQALSLPRVLCKQAGHVLTAEAHVGELSPMSSLCHLIVASSPGSSLISGGYQWSSPPSLVKEAQGALPRASSNGEKHQADALLSTESDGDPLSMVAEQAQVGSSQRVVSQRVTNAYGGRWIFTVLFPKENSETRKDTDEDGITQRCPYRKCQAVTS